ncbi:MAG: EamA family transporter [Bacteroidetes bacterium]|nr:EamA family transporter [Bacteroidota bacterium]
MWAKYKYHVLMHGIIFLWGFTGILGKLIHLEAVFIVWYRVLIASLFLAAFLLYRKKPFQLEKKHLWKVTIVGLFVVGHWLTFYYAIQLSTASLGILCLSTATLHVTWLEPLVMKRRFSWMEFAMGGLVIYGIYFVSDDFTQTEFTALYIGLISAFCAASFSVLNAKLAKDIPAAQITFYELSIGLIVLTLFLLFTGQFSYNQLALSGSDFSWLLFLGIVCTSFAFLVTIEIVKRLGAFTVSLSINLEPIYTILLAIVILKEHELLNKNFYVGASVIILVVLANGILKYLQDRKIESV